MLHDAIILTAKGEIVPTQLDHTKLYEFFGAQISLHGSIANGFAVCEREQILDDDEKFDRRMEQKSKKKRFRKDRRSGKRNLSRGC